MLLTDPRKLTNSEIAREAQTLLDENALDHEHERGAVLLRREAAERQYELWQEIERRGNELLRVVRSEAVEAIQFVLGRGEK